MAEQIVNYSPIVHTLPAGQAETVVQNVDSSTPLYIFTTQAGAPVTIQIPSNEHPIPPHVIGIPLQPTEPSEVSAFIFVKNISIDGFPSVDTANKNKVTHHTYIQF